MRWKHRLKTSFVISKKHTRSRLEGGRVNTEQAMQVKYLTSHYPATET